ncbi:MAG: T9SS type B sorting domain-containing protein, partial [Legionellales bacterium]|nr:T9SS type B sorting domain-containing protein [Legionellales bacterium]
SPGIHIVTITDGQGCWSDPQEVMIVDYPHFFTPNGDGVNDTWKIIQQEGIPISQIYIFDRFGKLLKQLDPDSAGWDGTYNGSQMPATDYWFKIVYIEGADSTQKEFKAHFSLKR